MIIKILSTSIGSDIERYDIDPVKAFDIGFDILKEKAIKKQKAKNDLDRKLEVKKDTREKVTGVYYHKAEDRYFVFYYRHSEKVFIAAFFLKEDAVIARRSAEIEYGYKKFSTAKKYLEKRGIEL